MLRPAVASDVPAIAALVERAYAPWVPVVGRRPAPMADDYAARVAAAEVFVRDGTAGIAGLAVLESRGDQLWLDNLAIDPALQGQGVGQAALRWVEEEARRRGFREVRLLTNAAMNSNLRFYARQGYEEVERREEHGFRRIFFRKLLD